MIFLYARDLSVVPQDYFLFAPRGFLLFHPVGSLGSLSNAHLRRAFCHIPTFLPLHLELLVLHPKIPSIYKPILLHPRRLLLHHRLLIPYIAPQALLHPCLPPVAPPLLAFPLPLWHSRLLLQPGLSLVPSSPPLWLSKPPPVPHYRVFPSPILSDPSLYSCRSENPIYFKSRGKVYWKHINLSFS